MTRAKIEIEAKSISSITNYELSFHKKLILYVITYWYIIE